jgi:hypothetical protein
VARDSVMATVGEARARSSPMLFSDGLYPPSTDLAMLKALHLTRRCCHVDAVGEAAR